MERKESNQTNTLHWYDMSDCLDSSLTFARWGIFHAILLSADFFLYQDRQSVCPDLGPECLQRLSAMA